MLLFLVEAVYFEQVFSDKTSELSLQGFGKMLAYVPHSRASLILRLLDTTEVVSVLEEKYAPVLVRDNIQVLEHLTFFDLLADEVDMVLSFFKVSLARVQPNFVEVSVDDLTAKLFELVQ